MGIVGPNLIRQFPNALPTALSSFVGREEAVTECCSLLQRRRLVTLTGPGGIGKSRLGLQVARCSAAGFRDGVFLAELGSVEDPLLVPRIVAGVLGPAKRAGDDLIDLLVVLLRSQQLLLILDDCDRVVEASGALANRLLHDLPDLSILATCREPLDVRGEAVWRVPPLRTPRPYASFHEIADSEAVHLFVERAKEVAPWFELDTRNAPRVADLCRRLDGIPLAIELAAPRLKALNLDQLLDRLQGSFELQMRGSRTAPTRQQTLRATLDWSYQLLSEVEQALFRRLSVFSGGFVIEAAEWVTQGEPVVPGDTLSVLERLIDKSLVVPEMRRGVVRHMMLEVPREYARERLVDAGEEPATRRRHFDWMLRNIECIDPDCMTFDTVAARELDTDNLRSALAWAIETSEAESAMRLAVAAGALWAYSGLFTEGISWLKRTLELSNDELAPSLRGRAFKWMGILSFRLGDMNAARAAMSQAHELLTSHTEVREPPFCSQILGDIERASGNLDYALRLYTHALSDYEERGLRFWEQFTLFMIGSVLFEQGDYAGSREACLRSLAMGGQLSLATARVRIVLAYLADHDGDRSEAERLAEEALAQLREQRELSGVAIALRALSQFALEEGRLGRAWVWLAEALDVAVTQADRMALGRTLETVACVLASGAPSEAARIAGAAATLRARTDTKPWPTEQARLERWLAVARGKLSERAYADNWCIGATLSDADAVTAARRFAAKALDSYAGPTADSSPSSPLTEITERQRQVAALVANGLTNEQIGAELVISPATARTHVEHILSRLNLHGRTQLAAWAGAHGLGQARPAE